MKISDIRENPSVTTTGMLFQCVMELTDPVGWLLVCLDCLWWDFPDKFRFTLRRVYLSSSWKMQLYFPWSSSVMLVRRIEQFLLFSATNVWILPSYLSKKIRVPSLYRKTPVTFGFSICHLNPLSEFLLGQEHGRRTLSSKMPLIVFSSSPEAINTINKTRKVLMLHSDGSAISWRICWFLIFRVNFAASRFRWKPG